MLHTRQFYCLLSAALSRSAIAQEGIGTSGRYLCGHGAGRSPVAARWSVAWRTTSMLISSTPLSRDNHKQIDDNEPFACSSRADMHTHKRAVVFKTLCPAREATSTRAAAHKLRQPAQAANWSSWKSASNKCAAELVLRFLCIFICAQKLSADQNQILERRRERGREFRFCKNQFSNSSGGARSRAIQFSLEAILCIVSISSSGQQAEAKPAAEG